MTTYEKRYLVDDDTLLIRRPSPHGKGHEYLVEAGPEGYIKVWDSYETKMNVLLTAMAWETGGITHGDPKLEFNKANNKDNKKKPYLGLRY